MGALAAPHLRATRSVIPSGARIGLLVALGAAVLAGASVAWVNVLLGIDGQTLIADAADQSGA